MVVVFTAMVFFTGSACASKVGSREKARQVINHNLVDYMTVMSAKKGHLKRIGKKEYIFSINYRDHDQIILFGNSPQKKVSYISMARFLSIWFSGRNNLQSDPPNAALTADQIGLQIVKLTNIELTKRKIIYHLHQEWAQKSQKTQNLTDIVLSIDQFHVMGGTSCNGKSGSACGQDPSCEWSAMYIYTPQSGTVTSCLCMPAGTCTSKNPNPFSSTNNCGPANAGCGYVPIVPDE